MTANRKERKWLVLRKVLTQKVEIITEATQQFLEKGYSNTTVSAIAKGLEMSQGNLTFHFPTKEHLLSELIDMLCDYQWKMMKDEANERSYHKKFTRKEM